MKRILMERLVRWKDEKDRKPLLLKGVRQVGKTFLLKEFGRLYFPVCHHFNFEKEPDLKNIFKQDLNPERILKELSFKVGRTIEAGKDLVIFDEIQEAPNALTSLKYFQEDCPELHLCAAGSLLGLHLNSGSFPVGKVTFETLRPLSFKEFLMAGNDQALSFLDQDDKIPEVVHAHLLDELKAYYIVGGLPEVVAIYYQYKENSFEAFSRVRKKQDDLLNSYYADIAKHAGKVNSMHIDRIFHSVPMQMSKTQDGSISRFKFKGVVPGVSHYDRLVSAIDWLEAAGLIVKVHIVENAEIPFKAFSKENIFKLLLFDVGILGLMSELSPQMILEADYGSFKGYFVENYVAQELLAHHFETLYSWQEYTSEMEFLLEMEGKVIPIEVKSGRSVKAKSLKVFSDKYHPICKMVLSTRPFEIRSETLFCPLYLLERVRKLDFLKPLE